MSEYPHRFCPSCAYELTTRMFEGQEKLACPNCTYVHWDNPMPVVAVVIPHREGLVLILRGAEPQAGMWALPGGYVDSGELPHEAAIREVFEETGLVIEIDRLITMVSPCNDNQLLMLFLAKPVDGVPRPGSDARDARVFALNDLPEPIAFYSHFQVIADWIATQQ